MGDDANGGCCTLKRGSGIFILVLSILSLVGSIICAVIAGFSEMGLYTAFNWIHFVLLIYLISAASAYVCCRACGPKITGGLAVGYCVLAFVTFIVLATGQRSAIEHNCEGTVECASISDWDHPDPECGRKTSSFSLCYLPETDDRRRRLAALAYAEPEEASEKKKEKTKKTKKNRKKDGAPGPRRALQGCSLTGDLWSSPSGTTNHGNSDGWCYSELDQDVGCTESPRDCWETCLYYYGDDLVAIDWNDDGTCYCQNDCECMSDVGDDETYLITRDSRVGALPHECDDGVVTLYEDKSRGAGCDALDSSGNVVNTNSADHCCQGEGYCCDYGSCTSDSDYCGYRFRCGGRLFVAGPSGGTYYDATAYCSSIGASIATIYSATENELARQACGGSSCWIGLEEVGGSASTPKESQTWRWMDGSTASYTNWLSSEPQNHNGRDERNAMMNCCGTDGVDASGMWYDAPDDYWAPKPLCRTDGSGGSSAERGACTISGIACPDEHTDTDMDYTHIDSSNNKWIWSGTTSDGRSWYENDDVSVMVKYLYYSTRAHGWFLTATAPDLSAADPWVGGNNQVRFYGQAHGDSPDGVFHDADLYCGHDTGDPADGCSKTPRGDGQDFYWCDNDGTVTVSCGSATAGTCFSDDFSSIDSNWVSVDGDWSWSGGTVDNNVGNSGEGNVLYRDADYADGYLEASVSLSDGAQTGLLFRITDMPSAADYLNNGGQMYYCGIVRHSWVSCGRMNNAWLSLFTYYTTITHGQFYDLGINMDGSDFTVFLDGAEIGSFSDSSYSSGGIGLRTFQGHGTYDAISFKPPGCEFEVDDDGDEDEGGDEDGDEDDWTDGPAGWCSGGCDDKWNGEMASREECIDACDEAGYEAMTWMPSETECFCFDCCDCISEFDAEDDCWCGETDDGFDPGAVSESECAAAGCHYYGSPHHWCECGEKENCASVGGEWQCDVFGPVAVKGFPPPEVCDHDEDEDCGSDATSGSDADVTCSLVINDEITAVYVDGQDVTGSLCGEWPATLRFSSAASLFAISGYDNQGGCQYGGFAMRCSTADGTGPWHGLTADTQNWRASNWVSGSSWTQLGFDDSAWQTPSVGGEPQYGSELVGGGDTICVEGDFYFRREVDHPTPLESPFLESPFLVTGDLTFEGMTYEAARDNTDVFVAAVADLCGVAASAVTVEISEARRRRLAEGIVVTYTVGVATANEAQAVTSAISSSSTADVDAAISKAATDAGVDEDFDGVTTTNVGTPTTTASGDDGSSDGNGGADAASAGLIAGVVVGVAALAAIGVGAYVYMRSKASGADSPPLAEVQLVGSADEAALPNTSDSSGSPSTMGGKEVEMSDADFGNIERKVLLEDRPWTDRRCGYFSVLCVLFFICSAIGLGATGAPRYDTNSDNEIEGVNDKYLADAKKCCDKAAVPPPGAESLYPTGFWEMSEMCREMEDNNQWDAPSARRRRLASKKNTPVPQNVWEGFSMHPGIPIGVVAIIMFLCGGFLKLMEKVATHVLFGTFLAEAAFCIYLGVGGEQVEPIMFVIAALIGVYVYCVRAQIRKAGNIISVASNALLSMPSLMCLVYTWMLASASLVIVLILVASAAGRHAAVKENTEKAAGVQAGVQIEYTSCDWKDDSTAGGLFFVMYIIWVWMGNYVTMTQVYYVAGCTAQYVWDPSLVKASMPLTLLKLAFTRSGGTVSKTAWVLQVINYIKKNSKCSCRNCLTLIVRWPIVLLACIVRCCCFTWLEMLNKYVLVFHVITADEFWLSAKRCYKLMKKRGLGALVMETSAQNSFVIIGYGLSLCVGIFTWWWMGVEYGKDVLGNNDMWGDTDTYGPGWPKFMIIVMALMLIAPAAAMAIIIIVAMAVGDSITRCWIPWCCGVFCGAVTAFFFWQTVNALLVASNAAFVCIAIDKENGVGEVSTSAEGGALYALVQGEIAEEVQALKEGGEEVPEFEAVAVTPKAAAGGAAEMTAVPPLMPPPPPTGRNFCSNCGAPLQGSFCSQCGARA